MRLTKRTLNSGSLLFAIALIASVPHYAHAAGMPQLNFSDWLVQGQVLWGAVIFVLFYLALRFSSLPKINNTLERRNSRIKSDLNLAHQTKLSADQAHADMLLARKEALEKAQQRIRTIHETIAQETKEASAQVQEHLEASRTQALVSIQKNFNQACVLLPETALEIASFVAGSILKDQNPETLEKALKPIIQKNEKDMKALHTIFCGDVSEKSA